MFSSFWSLQNLVETSLDTLDLLYSPLTFYILETNTHKFSSSNCELVNDSRVPIIIIWMITNKHLLDKAETSIINYHACEINTIVGNAVGGAYYWS